MPCPICGRAYLRSGRRRYCSDACRTQAWRRRINTPTLPPPQPRVETVYQCPECETRFLGVQRCEDCNTWARRVGPGAPCPHCEEPVAVFDLLPTDQFARRPLPSHRPTPS